MKKTYSTEEASGLGVQGQGGDQRVGDTKEIYMIQAVMLATTAGNQAHQEKLHEIQRDAKVKRRKEF